MLSPIINLFTGILRDLYQFTGNWGAAIILLTIGIRLLIMPLTWHQMKSMKKVQAIQPEIEAIKEKYKDDKEKANEETMKLMRERGANPAGGCIPLIVQLPILWAFFRALYNDPSIGGSFLWIPNITQSDPLYILPVLAAIATYWQSQVTGMNSTGGNQGMQQTMTYIMPVFIGFLASRYPAGLALYWVISSLFGVLQQYLIPTDDGTAAEAQKGEA